jgi:hypothetical protein
LVGLPNPDSLTDDEVISAAACGLARYATFTNILSFGDGKLSLARYWHP